MNLLEMIESDIECAVLTSDGVKSNERDYLHPVRNYCSMNVVTVWQIRFDVQDRLQENSKYWVVYMCSNLYTGFLEHQEGKFQQEKKIFQWFKGLLTVPSTRSTPESNTICSRTAST